MKLDILLNRSQFCFKSPDVFAELLGSSGQSTPSLLVAE